MVVSLLSTFRLTCRGQSEVAWEGPDYLIEQTLDNKRDLFVSTVTVDKATARDTGEYTCSYYNQTGESSIYIYVPGMKN